MNFGEDGVSHLEGHAPDGGRGTSKKKEGQEQISERRSLKKAQVSSMRKSGRRELSTGPDDVALGGCCGRHWVGIFVKPFGGLGSGTAGTSVTFIL